MENPGVDKAAGEAPLDEVSQFLLLQRHTTIDRADVRRADGGREDAAHVCQETDVGAVALIWKGDGLQGYMIGPMYR